jgi:ABC-type Na+ transport system ATPase subunit NatA
MIKVEGLTKRYARTVAVDDVSFEVSKGQIVGFLGPNGAGKTTTMRVVTCFLPPTAGTAEVAGYNIGTHPMEVKRRIGYLPETPPLYPEMEVVEYLQFVGRIKGMPKALLKSRLDEVLERCSIADVRTKLISKLSKGYRQRVGLAQAIIHNPDVLILDEPTSGLDPKQIIETRELIKIAGGGPHHHPVHPHPSRSGADLPESDHHQQGQSGGHGLGGEPHQPAARRGGGGGGGLLEQRRAGLGAGPAAAGAGVRGEPRGLARSQGRTSTV